MNDDWRLQVDLREDGIAHDLSERLEATELEHDLQSAFDDRVIVSRDGSELFCYAGSRDQLQRAEKVIQALAAKHGWQLDTALTRWHASAGEWEDADKALADTDAELAAERAKLIREERAESEQRGYPEWEVRVQCGSREDASKLSQKLNQEGVPHVQRWAYLLIGALDEDSAQQIAARIEREAPAGTTASVEGTLKAVSAELPPNPFAFFGGLGA